MVKAKKESSAPKRPLSSYMFYAKHRRPLLKESQPDLKFGEYSKIIGREWREMEGDTKAQYNKLAEDDKKRYILEKKEQESK